MGMSYFRCEISVHYTKYHKIQSFVVQSNAARLPLTMSDPGFPRGREGEGVANMKMKKKLLFDWRRPLDPPLARSNYNLYITVVTTRVFVSYVKGSGEI